MSENKYAEGRARGRGRINTDQPSSLSQRLERPPLPRDVPPVSTGDAKRSAYEPSSGGSNGGDRRPRSSYPQDGGGNGGGDRRGQGSNGSSSRSEAGGSRGGDGPSRGNGSETQRGAMRGRRMIYDIIKTRATTLATKKGVTGTTVKLQSNYFRLLKKPTWSLYQYHVDFSPPIEFNALRKGLIREQKDKLGANIFDGSSLYLTNKLPSEITEFVGKTRNDEIIKITVKFVALVSMQEGRSVQILNIIMRKSLEGLKLQLVGRNFFDAIAKIRIQEFDLELWPGYVTSIRQHEQDVLLCAEISHKVMRTETVYDLLKKVTQRSRGDYQTEFARLVIGMVVLTDYNNKFYRVDDVDFNSSPSKTFKTKTGETSFIEYYKMKYNKNIRDGAQPMLISRAKERDIRAGQAEVVALVPELCRATGITEEMRTNFQLMKAMGQYTQVGPDVRINKLLQFNRRLKSTPLSNDVFTEWQMNLDENLVELSGRELKSENIVFGNAVKFPSGQGADWQNAFKSTKMFSCADLNNWFIIAIDRNMREAQDFIQVMIDAGRGMGFNIKQPQVVSIRDDRPQTYITALDQCANKDPQLIMCIAPNARADRYSAIKKQCCVNRAIPTQVMQHKTITPKRGGGPRTLMSIATKVAIQLNCKLGHAPWMIEIPLSGLMTIGFDVCHDSTNKAKSYGALVATMDLKTSARYFSAVSAHQNGEELSNQMALNVTKALQEYRSLHNALPSKIVFYRDGVGEGQLQFVIDHEIALVKEKLAHIYKQAGIEKGYNFAYIVCSKRINTRFFKGRSNPVPGTVVDDVVTAPESYDFYLVSQSTRQGTVSPSHYNVVTENLGLPADKIQILTYKQCHLYYNWPGTTRVPAVCQYAHKLAFLVGQFIHQAPSNLLEKQLYFL